MQRLRPSFLSSPRLCFFFLSLSMVRIVRAPAAERAPFFPPDSPPPFPLLYSNHLDSTIFPFFFHAEFRDLRRWPTFSVPGICLGFFLFFFPRLRGGVRSWKTFSFFLPRDAALGITVASACPFFFPPLPRISLLPLCEMQNQPNLPPPSFFFPLIGSLRSPQKYPLFFSNKALPSFMLPADKDPQHDL